MTDVDQPSTAAAAAEAERAMAPELVANSLGDYLRAAFDRVRAGESGVLPVVAGLLLISASVPVAQLATS